MAKCVKSKISGEIIRVSDDEAAKLVKAGRASYVPKSDYKAQEEKANA